MADSDDDLEPLAIVGFSFKFPRATSPDAFWKMMMERKCTFTEYPSNRPGTGSQRDTDAARLVDSSPQSGHFLDEDVSLFDAYFFNIDPTEAELMDPQQRLILETVYLALENAGLTSEMVTGSATSVYVGSSSLDYAMMQCKDPLRMPMDPALGIARSMMASRVSSCFDFHGPSMVLDSSCSDGLAAVELACQSIWRGDVEMALAIGSNLILARNSTIALDNKEIPSRGSRIGRGEGVAVLVIKRFEEAVLHGDMVRAVIRSAASSHDGAVPLGRPNRKSQTALVEDTYLKGGLDPSVTRYFEINGPGTITDDAIQAHAIAAEFRQFRSARDPIYVGSIKSNLGQLEGASGVASVIKVILTLEKGIVPPNRVSSHGLNGHPNTRQSRINIPENPVPWYTSGLRRASVHSFGFNGSSSHLVLDDAYNSLLLRGLNGCHCTTKELPAFSAAATTRLNEILARYPSNDRKAYQKAAAKLLILSTADKDGVSRLSNVWRSYFTDTYTTNLGKQDYLRNLCFTLAWRRNHLGWRTFVVADATQEFKTLPGRFSTATRSLSSPKIAFVFTGEGQEWAGMGCDLLNRYPVFRLVFARANSYLRHWKYTWDIFEELQMLESASNINKPEYSFPICTVLQIALFHLLESWNIKPAVVFGFGSGEIAAAYCTRALDFRSALKIACCQGRLVKDLPLIMKSAVLSVNLSEAEMYPYIRQISAFYAGLKVSLSSVNSKKNVSVSGGLGQLNTLKKILDRDRVRCEYLEGSIAYHSSQMRDIAPQYEHDIKSLSMQPSTGESSPPMISTVKPRWIEADELLEPEYWGDNLVCPVQFFNVMSRLCSTAARNKMIERGLPPPPEVNHILEIGPHSSLQQHTADIIKETGKRECITYLSMLTRNKPSIKTVLDAAGQLYCAGYPVDLDMVNGDPYEETPLKMLCDLPVYPFNHSTSYWRESQISRNYRDWGFTRLPLLGVQDPLSSAMEPRWRNILRQAEIPWMKDHKINGSILYPAAGMLAIVIEAAKLAASPQRTIEGFSIRDTIFHSPLLIPDDPEGVEIIVGLQQDTSIKETNSSWFGFRIHGAERNAPEEHCRGSIQVIYASNDAEFHNDLTKHEWLESRKKTYEAMDKACTISIDTAQFYHRLAQYGYEYGPAFNQIKTLRRSGINKGQVLYEIPIFHRDDCEATRVTIHPTVLDGILQATTAIYTAMATREMPAALPTRIDELWISNASCRDSAMECIKVSAVSNTLAAGETAYSIIAVDNKQQRVFISIDGLQVTAADPREDHELEILSSGGSLCHHLDWRPDVDLLTIDHLKRISNGQQTPEEPVQFYRDLDLFLTIYILKTLEHLRDVDCANFGAHMKRYMGWMSDQKRRLEAGECRFTASECQNAIATEGFVDELHRKLESASKEGLFFSSICRNLVKLLKQEINPEDHLGGRLVTEYCREMIMRHSWNECFGKYLDLLGHKNPQLKVLQVGVGNTAMASAIAEILSGQNGNQRLRHVQWDYTDTTTASLRAAQCRLESKNNRMRFSTFNIEEDPETQGLEFGTYDVIVTAAVLHAVTDLKAVLKHARKLLKEGGKLLLFEPVRPDVLRITFAFGLLGRFWAGAEKRRESDPCFGVSKWDKHLIKNGFSGSGPVFPDYQDPSCHEMSIICSTAVGVPQKPSSLVANILHLPTDPEQMELAYEIDNRLVAGNFGVSYRPVLRKDLTGSSKSTIQICLFELNQPRVFDLSKDEFKYLKKLLTAERNILWVNGGGGAKPDPRYRVVDGLFRSVCSEDEGIKVITLSLDPAALGSVHPADQVMKVFDLLRHKNIADLESEYIEMNGLLHIGRLVDAKDLNYNLCLETLPQQIQIQPFAAGPRLQIDISTTKPLRNPRFIEDRASNEPLGPTEIEVEVKAVGVTFTDRLVALGHGTGELGREFAGVVTRAGPKCQRFQEGDRVASCYSGCYKSHIRLDEGMVVVLIPQSVSFCQAAAIPASYGTAWIALHDTARLRPGETVLIHSAVGYTGLAAIQLAQHLGAIVFATVRRETEKQLLIDQYKIPAEHILSSKDAFLAQCVHALTGGHGVDIILSNLQPGDNMHASWECIAPCGRLVDITQYDIASDSKIPMRAIRHNTRLALVNLFALCIDRPRMVISAMEKAMALVGQGGLFFPEPLKVYSVSDIDKAFRMDENDQPAGKVVVSMGADDMVLTVLDRKPKNPFPPDATYVISGGLGGLGRSIVHWLVKRGARNLILLTRSGTQSSFARKFIAELLSRDVHVVAPRCDISNASALASVLSACTEKMPPIRGCILASMVLENSSFEKMSYKAWRRAMAPKAQGSWNLHHLLPRGIDFFVMLSAATGLTGAKGQSNYAAGNTFQDGLARYRVAIGEKAVALDLSYFASIGVLHENAEVRERLLRRMEFEPNEESDLLAVLDQYCHATADSLSFSSCQITVGILRQIREKGFDTMDWTTRPMFNHLTFLSLSSDHVGPPRKPKFARIIGLAFSLAQARGDVVAQLQNKLAKFLSIPPAELDPEKPIAEYGLDSLLVTHLRHWIANETRAKIKKSALRGGETISSIANWIVDNSGYARPEWEYRHHERVIS